MFHLHTVRATLSEHAAFVGKQATTTALPSRSLSTQRPQTAVTTQHAACGQIKPGGHDCRNINQAWHPCRMILIWWTKRKLPRQLAGLALAAAAAARAKQSVVVAAKLVLLLARQEMNGPTCCTMLLQAAQQVYVCVSLCLLVFSNNCKRLTHCLSPVLATHIAGRYWRSQSTSCISMMLLISTNSVLIVWPWVCHHSPADITDFMQSLAMKSRPGAY